jgi:hypothetical protein
MKTLIHEREPFDAAAAPTASEIIPPASGLESPASRMTTVRAPHGNAAGLTLRR